MNFLAEDIRQDLTRIVRRSCALIAVTTRLVATSKERLVESEKLLRTAEDKASLSAR